MNYKFKQLVEALLKEVDAKNIGVFPGKFKPPHKGHYKTCEVASSENDIVIVLISEKEHEGYTADTSLAVWNIYNKHIPNIIPFVVRPTPVLACYELANIFNNGEYLPSPQSSAPKSNITSLIDESRVIQSFLNVGNNVNLNLYSSPEDQARFERMRKEPYIGKTVIGIDFKPVDRMTSATKFREALTNKGDILSFLPCNLPGADLQQIINILNG